MILRFFRQDDSRRQAIRALHVHVIEASRARGLYLRLQVPDTVEGRFESLVLHATLVLRRLRGLPPPADEVAQDLVNSVFSQLDASLRELGVGDFGVPKRMKKLGAAFYGRAGVYDAALDAADRDALAASLARNVLGTDNSLTAQQLAAYVAAAAADLETLDLDGLMTRGPRFPAPDRFAVGIGPA